ncbi:hypothetical protein ACIRYZ_37105 [Kitasatospora sp. NPDC101155]|uniref:hypothetical protein n=1 Tax=Kitasatospora sp. NPDC101155 TaxID=3364097 RepID=UPI003802923E
MIAALIRKLGRFTAGATRAASRRPRKPRQRPDPAPEPRSSAGGLPAAAGAPAAGGDEMERLLAAALLAGLIAPAEYRRAMTVLARADDAGRPLDVPLW